MCKQDEINYFCVSCGIVLETQKGDIYATRDVDNRGRTHLDCVGLCTEVAVGETFFEAAPEVCSECRRSLGSDREAHLLNVVARTQNWARVATNRYHPPHPRAHRLNTPTVHQARLVTITPVSREEHVRARARTQPSFQRLSQHMNEGRNNRREEQNPQTHERHRLPNCPFCNGHRAGCRHCDFTGEARYML